MLYIVILLYIIYLIWKYDINRCTAGKWIHYRTVLLLFILVAGLSYRLGVDTIRYEYYFYDPFEYRWDGLFKHMLRSHGEPLFVLTNLLVKDTFGEFFMSRLVMSIFYNTVFFWFVRKHSPAPFTTIFLYAVFQYFNFNFQVVRETMAVACFLIGFDGLLQPKPKYIKYVCCIILAMGFHHFAFIALFFPLFFILRPGNYYLILLVAVFLLGSFVSVIIGNIAELEMLDDSLSSKLDDYVESSRYGLRSISSVVNWVAAIFGVIVPSYILVYLSKKVNPHPHLVSLALLYILITILRYTSFGILFRINSYLFFCYAIVISQTLYKYLYHKRKRFIKSRLYAVRSSLCFWCFSFLVIFRFTFLLISGNVMYYPYSSVITHDLDEAREALYLKLGVGYKNSN